MGTFTTAIAYVAQYTSAGCVPDRNGNGGGNYTTCAPDYAKQDAFAGYIDAWAALPSRADGADIVPGVVRRRRAEHGRSRRLLRAAHRLLWRQTKRKLGRRHRRSS